MREDGVEQWVMYWGEQNRSGQRRVRRGAGASRDDRVQLTYDTAVVVIGGSGIAVLLHALAAGISG